MASSQEGEEAKLESQTEKFDLRQNAFILEHLLEKAELQWKETENELEGVLTEGKLKEDEKSLEYLASKIELMRDKAKMDCLLEQMKSVRGDLESQRWKKRLSDNMEKAEFILQEMKSMLKEGLEAPGLEIPLEEQISKSELLLEEIELAGVVEEEGFVEERGFVEEQGFEERFIDVVVKSPVLKMQLKKHIVKVESLLENMKFVHEEKKEDTAELKFLLKEMKLAQESGKVKSSSLTSALEAYLVKLKLLLDETELEKEKEGLGSQMLEKELLEELIKDGLVLIKSAGWFEILVWWRNLKKILSILQEMESEHKGEGLKSQVLEVILEQKEKEEHATTSKSSQEKMELVQEESNIKSPALGMKLKECIVELDGVLKKEKLKIFEEKLKLRKLKIQLHGHLPEMESLLEKLKREKKKLWSQALEMELKEDLENLELPLEETKLEERHAAKLKRFIVKAEKINSVPNESKTKSAKLEMQFEKRKEELKSLLYELEYFPRLIGTWQIKIWRQREATLEFLLEGIEFKQEEERLLSRELKMELKELEWLVKEIESEQHIEVPESLALKMRLEGHLGKVKSLLEAVKMEHEEENPELPAMKVQLEDRILHTNEMMFLTSKQRFKECRKALDSLEGRLSLIQFTGELKSQALKMELDKHIGELKSLLKKEKPKKPSFENWGTHIQKSNSLLKRLEWECNEEILQPFVWEMILKGHTAKEKSVLPETFATELKQHIVQLESLIVETKLKQEEGLKSQILSMEFQLKLLELELLQKERRLEMMLKSPVSYMELEENIAEVKSRLKTVKLEREKQKTELKALEVKMKQEKQKPESPTGTRELRPGEQEVLYKPIGALHVIVIGGRDQDGQSLNSVEGYIFLEGRWIELSAMNTPRSFMSSVVVGQEVIVSGGDTGDAITDTIEVLNLAETPLQWKISPAKLPVPLSAHQTVVFEGKLIVIGGHDGNEGRRSDRIYEVRLTPPYTTRILATMDTPVAWHGAALMGDEIFIFGGEIGGYVPTPNVLVFDLNSNMFSERQPLPHAVKGMATVVQEQSVAVIGGLDRNDQELDSVFMYDTRSGERHDLPQMSEERGACSAAISFTLDTGGYTDALFVAGSVRSVNTVERFSFASHRWIDMPPTREARGFCSIVNAPKLPLE